MDIWRHDLRSAVRALGRSPGFTLVTVVSAALGIGMATLAFSVAGTLLWKPFPFPRPDRLAVVSAAERPGEEPERPSQVSAAEFFALGARCRSFAARTAYRETSLTLLVQGRPEEAAATEVSADFFRVLGTAPQLGRTLRPGDDRLAAPPVAVLGDWLWQRRFGGDPGIVGKTILIDETPTRVIGVMPPGFSFPRYQELWVPFAGRLAASPAGASRNLSMAVRLRSGVSLDAAQAEVRTAGRNATLQPLRASVLSPETRLALRYLGGAAAFIFLIACVNLTHFLLVRRTARRQELAVRAAFGAGPGRLARQIFTESFLLAAAGGVPGIAFAAFLLTRLGVFEAQSGFPLWIRFTFGPPVFLFSLAATAAFALLLGLPAAWREARRKDLSPVLKETADAGGSRRLQRLRATFLVCEVAAAVVLLTGASLTVRSLLALRGEPGGVHTADLKTLWVRLPASRYADGAARARWIEDVLARLRTIHGVQADAASDDLPHYFHAREGFLTAAAPHDPQGRPGTDLRVPVHAVSPGYFAVLGTPLVAGRDLTGAVSDARGEAVVSESLAHALWPRGPAVGRRVLLRYGGAPASFTIVGVAADIRHGLLSAAAAPALYVPLAAGEPGQVGFLFSTGLDTGRLFPEATRRIQAADPRLPVFDAMTLGQLRAFILANDSRRALLALLCAAAALVLTLLGVYGVLASTVSRQLRAIGVRLALGATRRQVMGQIVGCGLALTLVGLALGLAGALLLGRLLAPYLYQVSPTDPASFAGIAVLVFDAAFIACYLPARRVLEVDPVEVLREE
jgi:predicted permease